MAARTAQILVISALSASLASACGDSCFARGTLVATPTGEVRIEAIKTGDEVLSYDHDAQTVVAGMVTATAEHEEADFGALSVGSTLHVTDNHPIFADGRYTPAGEVRGQAVLCELVGENAWPRTAIAAFSPLGRGPVYDITVTPHHNFFAGGILVHNKSYGFDGSAPGIGRRPCLPPVDAGPGRQAPFDAGRDSAVTPSKSDAASSTGDDAFCRPRPVAQGS